MKVVGIIAEYNPMHKGHIEQLRYARENLGADYVIIAMSGDFTQRGIPAVMCKYDRARLALIHGADLIIEIPTVAATSSAAEFARCGVSLLENTGIVTHLLFGAETQHLDMFYKTSELLSNESFMFRKTLRDLLKSGLSFAKARSQAMEIAYPGEGFGDFLSTPNNILGVEYVKALNALGSNIIPCPMKRVEPYSSTQIRKFLESNDYNLAEPFVSDEVLSAIKDYHSKNMLVYTNDFSMLLHERLLRYNNFSKHMDGNDELSRRILKKRNEYTDFSSFADKLKVKNITRSHIMRFLSHILLYITKEDHSLLKEYSYAPYIHILDFKNQASQLLSLIKNESKPPMFAAPQIASKQLEAKAWTIFSKDLIASDIYRIIQTNKAGKSLPTEYTRHFDPLQD